MKKVIIIAGTPRSGSTLLCLMLANGKNGFAAGEMINVMRPNHTNQLRWKRRCCCSDPECNFWNEMSKAGEKHVYSRIFKKYNDIDLIVDSSKPHLWLKDQIKYSRKKDYKVIPVITYKTPLEFAYSKAKRNGLPGWKEVWLKNYRKLFGILDDFIAVNYKELAQEPVKKMMSLCRILDIPYFEGKEKFWNNSREHFISGSNSVKNADKLIYYDKQYDAGKLAALRNKLNLDDKLLRDTQKVLDAFEVGQKRPVPGSIYSLKNELAKVPTLSNFVYRIQATPYCRINRPMYKLTKHLLRLRKKISNFQKKALLKQ